MREMTWHVADTMNSIVLTWGACTVREGTKIQVGFTERKISEEKAPNISKGVPWQNQGVFEKVSWEWTGWGGTLHLKSVIYYTFFHVLQSLEKCSVDDGCKASSLSSRCWKNTLNSVRCTSWKYSIFTTYDL